MRLKQYQNGALEKIVSHGTEYEDASALTLTNAGLLSDAVSREPTQNIRSMTCIRPSRPNIHTRSKSSTVKLTCSLMRFNCNFKKLMPLKLLMHAQSSWPPKGNSLCQKKTCRMMYRSLRTVHSFFAQLTLLTNPSKSYASQCFSISQTLPKVSLFMGASTQWTIKNVTFYFWL